MSFNILRAKICECWFVIQTDQKKNDKFCIENACCIYSLGMILFHNIIHFISLNFHSRKLCDSSMLCFRLFVTIDMPQIHRAIMFYMSLPSIDRLRSWVMSSERRIFRLRSHWSRSGNVRFSLKSERRSFKQTAGTAFGTIYSQFLPSCLSQLRFIACCWFCYQTPSKFLHDSLKLPYRRLLSCRFSFLLFCCLLSFLLASLSFSHSLRLAIEFNSNQNLLTFVTYFNSKNNNK